MPCRLAHMNIDYSITLGLACALALKYTFLDSDPEEPVAMTSSPSESNATELPVATADTVADSSVTTQGGHPL